MNHMSLKDIFLSKESLWRPIFGNYVAANKSPLFSIFRKKVENPNITSINGTFLTHFKENTFQFIFSSSNVMGQNFREMRLQIRSKFTVLRTFTGH